MTRGDLLAMHGCLGTPSSWRWSLVARLLGPGVDEVEWQRGQALLHLAPGETTRRARRRLLLAAPGELPYVAGKRRKVPASRPSHAVCCPFAARGRVPDAVGAGAGAFCLLMSHETPEGPRVRALPSPYRARAVVSPGVSCL